VKEILKLEHKKHLSGVYKVERFEEHKLKKKAQDDKIVVQWSIRWKLMLVITLLMLTLVVLLTSVQISSQKKILEDDLDKRIVLMRENLIARGKAFISNLTQQVENDIAGLDLSGATDTVRTAIEDNSDISYAVLMKSGGLVLVHTMISDVTQIKTTPNDIAVLKLRELAVREYDEKQGTVIEIANPVRISAAPWGVLRLIYTTEDLDREIKSSRKQIGLKTNRMIISSVLTSAGFMGLCAIVIFILSARLSKPLIYLSRMARKLSKGDFSASSDIRITSGDEVGMLTAAFIEMSRDLEESYRKLEEYNRTLEQKVEERTKELHESLEEVREANRKIMDSIRYAKMIQESLLPDMDQIKAYLPDSFFIWMPRDIVGGDIFFADCFRDGLVIAIIDCTGHGVPGALLTMIASTSLRRIIMDEGCHDPARILKRLNFMVKTSLKQDTEQVASNDGLDAGICFIRRNEISEHGRPTTDCEEVTFAGARINLTYIENNEINVIKGDKKSIGYKKSDLNFDFSNNVLSIRKGMSFYMTTDGFTDQWGGEREFSFGHKRFRNLIMENVSSSFDIQRDALLRAFSKYKGGHERVDDVTVVGFGFKD